VRKLCVLRHVRQPDQPARRHRARIGRLDAGEDAQQRRLAGPIRPDQADPVAVMNPEREVGEQRRRAVRLGNLLATEQQRHPLALPARAGPRMIIRALSKLCLLDKPVTDERRTEAVRTERVLALDGAYETHAVARVGRARVASPQRSHGLRE
jgi:hypothetical protein